MKLADPLGVIQLAKFDDQRHRAAALLQSGPTCAGAGQDDPAERGRTAGRGPCRVALTGRRPYLFAFAFDSHQIRRTEGLQQFRLRGFVRLQRQLQPESRTPQSSVYAKCLGVIAFLPDGRAVNNSI